jgi:hypothetical protein
MARQVFNTSLAPDCQIDRIGGSLHVKGWDLPQIAVDADQSDLEIEEDADAVRFSCRRDCGIRLPHGATLEIGSLQGDAQIKLLDETLKLGEALGSLNLRNLAGAQIGLIHGDLSARSISGDLELGQVKGDVEARRIEGDFKLGEGGGDLDLQQAFGEVHAVVKGDARLRLREMNGAEYHLQAGGDVRGSLPADANLKLRLVSRGKSIRLRLPKFSQIYSQEQVELEVGGGDILLAIEAGGDISLDAQETGWTGSEPFMPGFDEEIAQQVEAQIGQHMQEMSQRLKNQMEQMAENLSRVGMSPDEAQRIVDQAMRASERETAKAQEKMRRAQEKLERKLQDAQRKAEQKARSAERSAWARNRHTWGRGASTPPPAPQPSVPPEPVSDDERLMILRMLEQKKISLEEAEQLLAALEGQD